MAARLTPEVLWAQRSCYSPDDNYVVLTIAIHDVPQGSLKLDFQERKVILDAHSDLKDTNYHLELNLHDDIYPDETEIKHTDRQLELKLFKAEPDYWWPALLSDADVPSYVKQDFDRWVNKDAQDGDPDPLEELVADMDRQELQAMADTALTSLPGFEHLVTYTERQSGVCKAARVSSQQNSDDDAESDDEDDEETSDNETTDFGDNSDSDDEDPPSPPGGGGTTGHASGGRDDSGNGHSSHDDSVPQNKDSSRGIGPSTSDNTGKEHSHPSDKDCNAPEKKRKANEDCGGSSEQSFKKRRSETSIGHAGSSPEETPACRDLPVGLQPLSFEEWKKSVARSVELSNVKSFPLMKLPVELRLDIFELVLAVYPGDLIHFCPELHPGYQLQYEKMLDQELYYQKNGYHRSKMRAAIRKAENADRSHYCYGDIMDRCGTPALLHVSRQVAEEACQVLYRRNTFAFRDINGFVALEGFLRTIGHFGKNQLRKLDVHIPIWFHGLKLDKLRSTWIAKASKTFGLQAAVPHTDRLGGSFEWCINTLAWHGTLTELNLIITPDHIHVWEMEHYEGIPGNTSIAYARRLSLEEHMFEHVLAKIPNLAITVVAEESSVDPKYREEEWEGERALYETYFAAIERKCQRYGFRYERRKPEVAFQKSHRMWALRDMHLSQGHGLQNLTNEDLIKYYAPSLDPPV